MRRVIISILLSFIFIPSISQVIRGDSIILSSEEARVLVKMTEDLKLTKQELKICDSIIVHKDSIINLKNELLEVKDLRIQEEIKKSKKKNYIGGGVGFILGLILGVWIL